MQRRELADLPSWPAEPAERLLRGAVDDAHLAVHAIDHVDEFLVLVGREHEVVDRARAAGRLLVDVLGDKSAILTEHLQAVVAAVADVDEIILVDADAMYRVAELLRGRLCRIVGRRLFVARRFPIGAPVALVVAGFGNRTPRRAGWRSRPRQTPPSPRRRRQRPLAGRAARPDCWRWPSTACRLG